jgi:hypothetical protein
VTTPQFTALAEQVSGIDLDHFLDAGSPAGEPDVLADATLLFWRGGERRMCHSPRWEYWESLKDRERREDEARRTFEVVDERNVPEPEPEPEPELEPESEPERELVDV